MNQAKIIFLITLLSMALCADAQNSSKKSKANANEKQSSKLIGTWRIVEYADFDATTGKWKDRYGKNPRGYFMYSKSGIVNINISTDSPMKISEDSAKNVTVNYFINYRDNAFGYFGTYIVDWQKSIVTHYVKGGSLLWYIDTDQPDSL